MIERGFIRMQWISTPRKQYYRIKHTKPFYRRNVYYSSLLHSRELKKIQLWSPESINKNYSHCTRNHCEKIHCIKSHDGGINTMGIKDHHKSQIQYMPINSIQSKHHFREVYLSSSSYWSVNSAFDQLSKMNF